MHPQDPFQDHDVPMLHMLGTYGHHRSVLLLKHVKNSTISCCTIV